MTSIEKIKAIYMGKSAALNPVQTLSAGMNTIFAAGNFAGAALLGIAAGTGVAAGWTTAQLTSHDKESAGTAKKEYDNQRLNADIGYLSGKIRDEAAAKAEDRKPKAARVLG